MDFSVTNSENGSNDIFSNSYISYPIVNSSTYNNNENDNDDDNDDDDDGQQDNDIEEDDSGNDEKLLNLKPIPIEADLRLTNARKIKQLDILKNLISQIGGKDKIAKLVQYTLNIIKFFLIRSKSSLIDFNNFTKINPLKFITSIIISNSIQLEKKISFITSQISSFRYALRFGTSPFKIISTVENLKFFYNNIYQFDKIKSRFLTESFLTELIDVYYTIFDELELLFKLKILTNLKLSSIVSKNAAIGWYLDILLTLKQKFQQLKINQLKQQDLKISIQVRLKANELSRKFIHNNNNNNTNQRFRNELLKEFNLKSINSNNLDIQLKDLKIEEYDLYLDIVKNSFDFICDSLDLFENDFKRFGIQFSPLIYLISVIVSFSLILKRGEIDPSISEKLEIELSLVEFDEVILGGADKEFKFEDVLNIGKIDDIDAFLFNLNLEVGLDTIGDEMEGEGVVEGIEFGLVKPNPNSYSVFELVEENENDGFIKDFDLFLFKIFLNLFKVLPFEPFDFIDIPSSLSLLKL
ncbi:hypothetical protein WICMUC_001375 [Wickerhamomyces mucosus]|uniref:Uncharacterized protein n=1 Tax=Wickerhamomyces mucosus TaxID=1378264 RepID=A0A9P8PUI7_9ASCO|nr:hypothetical protein WICMUC_001375 [Wickerhamomyces mucosus]